MAERRSVPIVFGGGLDRETGLMAMQPGGMEDLRNVHLLSGKYQVRRGFESVLSFTDDSSNAQTDVLAGQAVYGRRSAVYVTYDSVNYLVNVFVGDNTGAWATWLGEMEFKDADDNDLLGENNPAPPVIITTEYNNTVLIAHAAASVSVRAQTHFVYWDETTQAWVLEKLVVGTGGQEAWPSEQKVRFRGVCSYLEYIVGWGWGSDDDDRPEIVRISKPRIGPASLSGGTAFNSYHYWLPGDQGEPTIAVVPTTESMICFKETETYELYGRSRLSFGRRKLDGKFGMEQPRLAVEVEDSVFAWTTEGPRLFAPDGTSEGLEIPLELTLPEPYDLPARGSDTYAFAVYMPIYRSIWFVFGKRVYSLYIREEWKWGYQVLGFTPLCGFRLPQSGWGTTSPPTGYPSVSALVAADTTLELTWANNDQDGDETVEVWLKADGGSWALKKSYAVNALATQTVTDIEGLKAGWDYDVAVRYRRGSYYTFGYEGSDPDQWPVSSRGSFTTTLNTKPTIDTAVWSRTSASAEQVLLTITPPYTGTGYDVEIRRGAVLIYTETDVTGNFQYADTGCTGEADNSYDCRLITPYVNGGYTTATVRWAGPPAPTVTAVEAGNEKYTVEWTNAAALETQIYDSLPSELEVDATDNERWTESYNPPGEWIGDEIPGSSGLRPWIAIRHRATAYGVYDYSDWDTMQADGPM